MDHYPRGTILRRKIGSWFSCAWHWGIYVGGGEVIHFAGQGKKERLARIDRASLGSFGDGKAVSVQEWPECEAHGEAVCRQAESILNTENNGYNLRYSLRWNNCQDFCRHCFASAY